MSWISQIFVRNAMMNKLVLVIVCLNGVYDLVCSILILLSHKHMLSTLHIGMFDQNVFVPGQELWHRMLEYWIFTYGTVRLMSALLDSPELHIISAATYFFEALAYYVESWWFHSEIRHLQFLFISCTAIGVSQLWLVRNYKSPSRKKLFI